MPLSWNEIKSRALAFSKDWDDVIREEAEAKPFLEAFLNVFGINRRRVATFEHRVKKLNEADGYIDLLWKGVLLVEMKSRGKDLEKAYQQAKDYCHGLPQYELPQLILVSDFNEFHLYDDEGKKHEFFLNDFYKNVKLFSSLAGYQKREFKDEDPVNIHAAELMGRFHDQLKAIGYTGHPLELYLVRLLFCLFADDTGIFDRNIFHEYLDQRTSEDGSDFAMHLQTLFYILNTSEEKRLANLDEQLKAFPYVNGKLFEETLPPAAFDTHMRKTLLDCCALDWSKISPAIFGSLFQSVMNEKERRNLGAHYTSEKNILKVIKPLFLDELLQEFEKIRTDRRQLKKLHERIAGMRFLDPACGCGNFLIIAYRELRKLELEIIKEILGGQQVTSINDYFLLDVDRFYGIEYEEFPAQIAQVAMWLIDHQMNMTASESFGEYYVRLPLRKSATIVRGNALRIDWQSLIEPLPWEKGEQKFDYIFGNPPFVGSKLMNNEQRIEIKTLYNGVNGAGILDYVTGWYIKAANYIKQFEETRCAFVSTNSITQGEQVGVLWKELMTTFKIKIDFAHQTFKWSNEAKGVAGVYCVIIGFSLRKVLNKTLYVYDTVKSEPHEIKVSNINPYLIEGKSLIIEKRHSPLNSVPKMSFGNMPLDGGNLLLSDSEKIEFLSKEPQAERFIKPLISAKEFLNGDKRWCLWLVDAKPNEIRELPLVLERINRVREFRLTSIAPSTQKFAATPSLFRDKQNPESYVLIPSTTSENRNYIPIGFFKKDQIANNSTHIIPQGNLYHFAVITSEMHMAWVKYVCGRLESRYRYSKDIVYNNFPWPENPSDSHKETVEKAAQAVLDARAQFPESSLADLYDPNTMPPVLVKAHQQLDKAVDLCYRPQPFINESKRIEYLFDLYDKYTSGLFMKERKK